MLRTIRGLERAVEQRGSTRVAEAGGASATTGEDDSCRSMPLATPLVPMIHVFTMKQMRADRVFVGLPLT